MPQTYSIPDPTKLGVISPENLNPANPIALNPLNNTPVYPVGSIPTLTPAITPTTQETKISGLNEGLKNLYNSLLGRSTFQSEQEKKFGVESAQKNITDLNAQLTQLKNEAAAIPLQLERRVSETGTILTSAYTTEQNKRLRDNAIAALGVSTLLAASQGQLTNAQAFADRAVAQKYNPILEEIDVKTKNLKLIQDDPETSIEEKNRAQKQIDLQNQEKAKVALEVQNAKEIWDIATKAAANSNTYKPTSDYPTLSYTLQAISQATTKEQALRIAVKTGLVKTEAGKKQIIGSATTGYYTVDEQGNVTPLKSGTTLAPGTDFNAATKNLQAQRIPTTTINKSGSMALKYQKLLLDKGLPQSQIDWLWNAVIGGSSFEEIRDEIRKSGSDPVILDTFVQTLQGL